MRLKHETVLVFRLELTLAFIFWKANRDTVSIKNCLINYNQLLKHMHCLIPAWEGWGSTWRLDQLDE